MGVWDPTGGEPRPGSGLPVDEGREEIRVLTPSTGGGVHEISPEGLEGPLRDPAAVIWADVLRPREGAEALLRDALRLEPLTVEDCLQPLRMPKMDTLPEGGVFIGGRVLLERKHPLRARATDRRPLSEAVFRTNDA